MKCFKILFFLTICLLTVQTVFSQRQSLNVIEFGNDAQASDEFIYVNYRVAPEEVEFDYFYKDGSWTSHSYDAHGKKYDTDILWGISMVYQQPDTVNQLGFPIYKIPNTIPPRKISSFENPCQRSTKDVGVSHLFKDHQKDWDYLADTLDGILNAQGLTRASEQWDMVEALANWITAHRGGGTWVHPVDYVDSVAECTGAANTMVAFASILNIPARVVDLPSHACSEVYLNGKWRYVENTPYRTRELGALQKYSVNEMLTDPINKGLSDDDHYNESTNHRTVGNNRAYHYAFDGYTNWKFHWRAAYDQEYWKIDMVPNSVYELSTLYPGQDTLYYKGLKETNTVWMTPVKKDEGSFNVSSANTIRRYFDIPSLQGIKEVSSQILLADDKENQIPADGGNWYYKVNGVKYYIKDHGGFRIKKDHPLTGKSYLAFQIPMEVLNAGDESINYPPVIAEISNPEPFLINSGKQFIELNSITDGDYKEEQKLTISASSSNPTVISNLKVTNSNSAKNPVLSFIPTNIGVTKITVTAKDNGGTENGGVDESSESFELLVYKGNTRTIKIPAEADGYIRHSLLSKSNYGDADSIVVLKSWNDYFNQEGLFRFDLSNTPYPIRATLKLNGKSSGSTNLVIYGTDLDNWCEKQLSGDNAPYGYKPIDTLSVSQSGNYEFDVTHFVQNQKDDKVSFKIEPMAADSVVSIFKSSESLNDYPELVIETHGFIDQSENPHLSTQKFPATDDIYIQRSKTTQDVDKDHILVHTSWNSHNSYNSKSSGIGVVKFEVDELPSDFEKVYMSLTVKDRESSENNKNLLKNKVRVSVAEVPPNTIWNENTMDYEYGTIIGTDRNLYSTPYNYSVSRFLQVLNPENTFAEINVDKIGETYLVDITEKVKHYKDKGFDALSVFLFEQDRTEQGEVISTGTPVKFYSTESANISRDKMPALFVVK